MAKATQSVEGIKKSISTIKFAAIVQLGQQALQFSQQIYGMAKSTVDWADDLKDTAKAIGMTTTELQRWQYIAKVAGVDQQQLSLGLRTFINNMDSAKKGTGEAADAFREAGITSKDLQTALLQSANYLSKMKDGTEKAALSMKLFGSRAGLAMIELMDLGEKGIQAAINRMKELGLEFSEDKINKLASYKSRIEEMSMAWKVFAVDVTPIVLKGFGLIEVAIKILQKSLEGYEYPIEKLALAFQSLQRTNLQDTLNEILSLKKALDEAGDEAEKARIRIEIEKLKASMRDVKIGEAFQEFKEDLEEAAIGSDKLVEDILTSFKKLESPAWIKKWVEDFDELTYLLGEEMKKIGIVSQKSLEVAAQAAINYAKNVEKLAVVGKASAQDLINAYNAASEAMKKLPKTAQQVAEEMKKIDANKTDQLISNEEEYQKAVKELQEKFPERGEEYKKELQKIIDSWQKARKTIQEAADKSKLEIKATTDVSEAKKNLDNLIREYNNKTITINVKTEGGGGELSGIKAYGEPIEKFGVSPDFFTGGKSSGEDFGKGFIEGVGTQIGGGGDIWEIVGQNWYPKLDEAEKSWNDFKSNLSGGVSGVISFVGEGSTKKPITDKIKEIISHFGSLENALKNMEVNIEFIGLSANLMKLENQLKLIDQTMGGISKVVQWTGQGWSVNQGTTLANQQYALSTILPIKAEIEKIKAQMAYGQVEAYGGSMQAGGYVPRTGLYTLHEGERVISKSVTMGNIMISTSPGTSREQAKEIAEQLALILKYKRSGNLADYIR
jgi:hypothetical protein